MGRPAQTPSAGERSRTLELLVRLIENSMAVPLKLGSSLGEQPDFVVSQEVLRYVYALRGDRNFKTGPSTVGNEKVTPLALHCWEAIHQHGPLDVPALQPILGRDITEAAIARGLQELWTGMYIFPILSVTGKPAQWELLSRRFPEQVAAGANTGHAEAQSAMVSLYLHAAVAATEEEVFAFLSPLAAQSKLREVVRGLGSMRQLDIIDIDGRSHVCLQGGLLPEMVAQLSEEQLGVLPGESEIEIEAAPLESGRDSTRDFAREPQRPWRPRPQVEVDSQSDSRSDSDEPKRFSPKKFVPKQFVPRKFAAGSSTTGDTGPKRFAIRASGGGANAGSGGHSRGRSEERGGPRSGTGSTSRFSASRSAGAYPPRPRSFAPRDGEVREGRPPRMDASGKPATRGLGERAKRWEKSGEGAGGRRKEGKSFAPRSSGFKSSGFKSSGFKPAGDKPWASKGAPSKGGASKSWTPRTSSGAAGSGFAARERGEGEHDAGEQPKRWEKSSSATGARSAGSRPYAPKSTGFKPSGSKSGGFKSSGSKPAGSKPWTPRASSGAARDRGEQGEGERPKRWEKSGPGSSDRPAARKPSGFTSSGFKSAGAKSADSRSAGSKSFGAKPAGSKPWASKGASSRVGSARSYAARTTDGAAPRSGSKTYGKTGTAGKTGAAKPRTKRAADTGDAGDKPKRRERTDSSAGDKGGAKPFWSKNPRGGKGSTAGSRTNRPKGKKKAGKKK